MNSPEIFVWLGLPGSGRRALIYDVASGTSHQGNRTLFLTSQEEAASEIHFSQLPLSSWHTYSYTDAHFKIEETLFEESFDRIFWLFQGNLNPLDQIESLKAWLLEKQWSLTRILTVVSARLLEEHPSLKSYYEACIHFSDMVLLNQRENQPADWSHKFQQKYEKERFPCLFESVKKNRVKNPSLVLDSIPRRMSQYFDTLDETSTDAEEIEYEWDEDDAFPEDEEETAPEESYLARNLAGERKFKIPDLKELLGPL